MPVEAFEKRYLWSEGQLRQKAIFVVERCDDDHNSWWGMGRGPGGAEFGKINLRKYHQVKKEPHDQIPLDDLVAPTEQEKILILEQLEAFKSGGPVGRGPDLAPPPAPGGGAGAPYRTSPYVERAGLDPRMRAALSRPGRPSGHRPRRPWRIAARAREAGPARSLAAGAGLAGSLYKIYCFFYAHMDQIEEMLKKHDGINSRMERLYWIFLWVQEKTTDGWSWVSWAGTGCFNEWDSILILFATAFLFWCFLLPPRAPVPSGEGEAERDQLYGADVRHRESLQEQRRMHAEMMAELKGDKNGSPDIPWDAAAPGTRRQDFGAELARRADAMEAQLAADDPDKKSREQIKKTSGVLDRVRRLMKRAKNPLERALFLLSQFVHMQYWNMPDGYEERLGPDHFGITYNDGNARQRSLRWRRDHGGEKCKALEVHSGLADILDAATLDDNIPHLVNCLFFERIMRWQYGLEKVFEHCRTEQDWKGSKPKTRWALLAEYHPSSADLSESVAPEADASVQTTLQRRALFEKWLSKGGVAADGG
jgi:hypothetical protein